MGRFNYSPRIPNNYHISLPQVYLTFGHNSKLPLSRCTIHINIKYTIPIFSNKSNLHNRGRFGNMLFQSTYSIILVTFRAFKRPNFKLNFDKPKLWLKPNITIQMHNEVVIIKIPYITIHMQPYIMNQCHDNYQHSTIEFNNSK